MIGYNILNVLEIQSFQKTTKNIAKKKSGLNEWFASSNAQYNNNNKNSDGYSAAFYELVSFFYPQFRFAFILVWKSVKTLVTYTNTESYVYNCRKQFNACLHNLYLYCIMKGK